MSPITNLAVVNRFILEHLSKNCAQSAGRKRIPPLFPAVAPTLLREAPSIRNPFASSSTTRRKRMTKTTDSNAAKINNGVNVAALLGAREALEQAPEAAQFKWRASCEWVTGTHSRSVIGSYFGLGAEQSRDKSFRVEADHPKVFASEDNAPTPVEIVLSGLASCLTAGVAAVAQRRGIQLRSVKATVEGDMDIQGILGMDDDIRNGFGGIRVHFDIRADASPDDIKSLVAQSQKRSAVFDIVTNPTNVFVTVN
jgi:uncharacterized OsmC-like protein